MKISPMIRVYFHLLAAVAAAGAVKPTKSKYSFKGLGVNGYGSSYDTCLSTYLSVGAYEDMYKSGGPPTRSAYAYVNVEWYDTCTDEATNVWIDIPAPLLRGSLQKGATIQASFTEAEKCYNDLDLGEYVCESVPFVGTVSASFTPVGTPYKDRFQNQYASPGYRYKERSAGTSVDATASFAGTVLDGVPFVPGESSGYIHKLTSGSIEMVKLY